MAWLSEAEFRVLYVTESATAISSEQIEQCLDEAVDELSALCGDDTAAEIEAASDNTLVKVKRFRRAQGKLGYRELLFLMSARFRDGGIVVTERDVNDSVTNQYEKFADIEKRREALYAEALRIVGPYLVQPLDDSQGGGSIEFSHPAQSDSCCSGDYGRHS